MTDSEYTEQFERPTPAQLRATVEPCRRHKWEITGYRQSPMRGPTGHRDERDMRYSEFRTCQVCGVTSSRWMPYRWEPKP